jgi:hypothetical protein
MTQFLSLRQVFENLFRSPNLFKNFFTYECACLAKADLCAAKPSIMAQFFGPQPSF